MDNGQFIKRNKRVKVGDMIQFTEFSYPNTVGGVGSANTHPFTDLDIYFDGIATGTVVKEWEDYETGQVMHAKLDDKIWEFIKDKAKENLVYVSGFNLVELL